MINGSFFARRPFQEVVQFGLKFSILDITPGGPIVQWFAQQADPVSGEATRGPPISGTAWPSLFGVPVIQLQTEKKIVKKLTLIEIRPVLTSFKIQHKTVKLNLNQVVIAQCGLLLGRSRVQILAWEGIINSELNWNYSFELWHGVFHISIQLWRTPMLNFSSTKVF